MALFVAFVLGVMALFTVVPVPGVVTTQKDQHFWLVTGIFFMALAILTARYL